jgi:hypothetical protein
MAAYQPTVFDWLDRVRMRPGMFIGASEYPLRVIESLVQGYNAALLVHGIVEARPAMSDHFSTWLRHVKDWSLSCGWADAIERVAARDTWLTDFFALVDEYRSLAPTVVCSVVPRDCHKPTGKKFLVGYGEKLERPDRIDILQYRPEPLYFLRLYYGHRCENTQILQTSNGSAATNQALALEWVSEEFGIKPEEFETVT